MAQAVFHHLLRAVGDQHRYQVLATIFCSLIAMLISVSGFLNAYLFYQDDYQCDPLISDCKKYVCALRPDERRSYVDPDFSSMVSRFGDYRCQTGGELILTQSIIYFGGILGGTFSIAFLSFSTPRNLILGSTLLSLVGVTLTLLSQSLTMAAVGLGINFMGRCAVSEVLFSYLTDSVGEAIRVRCSSIVMLTFTMGVPLLALAYWVIRPWELALVVTQVIPLVIILIGFALFLEQTPMYLVTRKSSKQAVDGFARIAAINQVQTTLNEQDVAVTRKEYEQNQETQQKHHLSLADLFCFKSLIWTTILLNLVRFFTNYSFSGIGLMVRDYAINPYLNGILMGFSEVLSAILGMLTFDRLPRKITLIVSYGVGCAIALCLFLLVPCVNKDQCSSTEIIMQTIGVFVFRFQSSFNFLLHIMHGTELYPSQIRPIGVQLLALCSSLGFLTVYPIQSACEKAQISPFIVLAITSFLPMLLTTGLRETLGQQPAQMIEELQYESLAERKGTPCHEE